MFLGHEINENGCKPSEEKTKAISDYKTEGLNTRKQVKAFLGMTGYYRRFIENYSIIAYPLIKLLQNETKFVWGQEQQAAYLGLKKALMSKPILSFPDYNKSFNLTTDSSNFALGAVLSQGDFPNDHPIAYASRVLNSAEKNYSTIEKELLAIDWALEYFRPYI